MPDRADQRLDRDKSATDKRIDAEAQTRLREETLRQDYDKLLKMPEFQRVMHDILRKGGMFKSVMTGNSQTFYLSGKQDFTREIWAGIAAVDQATAFRILRPYWDDEPLIGE